MHTKFSLARYAQDVLSAESDVRVAKSAVDQGFIKLDSAVKKAELDLENAKADREERYAALKSAHEKAIHNLERNKIYHAEALEELERGFDIRDTTA